MLGGSGTAKERGKPGKRRRQDDDEA